VEAKKAQTEAMRDSIFLCTTQGVAHLDKLGGRMKVGYRAQEVFV
jgi:hypothetical protein